VELGGAPGEQDERGRRQDTGGERSREHEGDRTHASATTLRSAVAGSTPDPYAILGVSPQATDAELRGAYRRLAQRHHPDHNGGSPESAHRFAVIQAAYTEALERRRAQATRPAAPAAANAADPEVEARIAALERELQQAREARARAAAAARRAAADAQGPSREARRPTAEELGYVTTDDSLSKILDDAEHALADRLARLFGSHDG
jgi:hypothetical protein